MSLMELENCQRSSSQQQHWLETGFGRDSHTESETGQEQDPDPEPLTRQERKEELQQQISDLEQEFGLVILGGTMNQSGAWFLHGLLAVISIVRLALSVAYQDSRVSWYCLYW